MAKNRNRYPDDHFTMLPNELFYFELPCNSLAIYAYMKSKPEGWVYHDDDIQRRLGIGRDALKRGRRILVERHLLRQEIERGEKGQITGKIWDFLDAREALAKCGFSVPWSTIGLKSRRMDNPADGETDPLSNTYSGSDTDSEFSSPPGSEAPNDDEEPQPFDPPEEPASSGATSGHDAEPNQSTSDHGATNASGAEPNREPPRSRNGEAYAFFGTVIQLTETDYAKWRHRNFWIRDEFDSLLEQRDTWLAGQSQRHRDHWWFSTLEWLKSKNAEGQKRKKRMAI